MNDKHLHVLIPAGLHKKLTSQANRTKTSVGELVRQAVVSTYFDTAENEIARRQEAFARLLKRREEFGGLKGVDYKQLVEDGRRV